MVATAVTLTACGSASSSAPRTVGSVTAQRAGASPSTSAKMICEREPQAEIAASLGVKPIRVTTPTWADHVYSCTYVYPNGMIALSVKELNDAPATTSYFGELGNRLGRRPEGIGLGQEAFLTSGGSVVVRKDFKVLEVDISQLPAQFGQPALNPSDVALSVAATVMGCWTGA